MFWKLINCADFMSFSLLRCKVRGQSAVLCLREELGVQDVYSPFSQNFTLFTNLL